MAEDILHFGAVRYRLNGVGVLKHRFVDADESTSEELKPTPIENNGREPLRLSNFKSQRAKLRVYTTEIDEQVKINRIILFVKQLWSQYPG